MDTVVVRKEEQEVLVNDFGREQIKKFQDASSLDRRDRLFLFITGNDIP